MAKTDEELQQIYSFRYRIYVEEMGRTQHYADHQTKKIIDPLDTLKPNQFYAQKDGRLVGVVRTNYLRHGPVELYEELYGLPTDPDERYRTSVTTRLMLCPSIRSIGLGVALALATYTDAIQSSIGQDFIDCNAPLVDFFLKLGYRPKSQIEHPEYGQVSLMTITPQDLNHLRAVGSPFVPVLEKQLQGASA